MRNISTSHHTSLLHLIFTLSGACALIYQLAWVRFFSLEFGSTTLAVSTVVAVFMGGLALGALIGGRISRGRRHQLRVYGLIELCLAGYALLSPLLFSQALLLLTGNSGGGFLELTAWRFIAAVLLILPPTLLMGTTLPVLTTWLEQRAGKGHYRSTTLYSWNTLGAMLGVFSGGFVLLPQLGTSTTLWLAASFNLSLAVLVIYLSRHQVAVASPHHTATQSKAVPPIAIAYAASVALAAAATMACQVIWTRVAGLVLGTTVYAFTIVLATFLAGLAIGALLVSALLERRPHLAHVTLLGLLLASALAILSTTFLFPYLPVWASQLFPLLDLRHNPSSLLILQLTIAAVLMLPATLLFGGIFPAAIRRFAHPDHPAGSHVARLYAWDVVGSILGVLLAGFLLLPWVGANSSLALAALTMLMAGYLLLPPHRRMQPHNLASLLLIAAAVWLVTPQWQPQLMSSGPHSYAHRYQNHDSPESLQHHLAEREQLLYYADGLTATVSVSQDLKSSHRDLYIYTNGKIDGSSRYDMPTQRLAAHLPMLLHPHPEQIAVVGMGTGTTPGSAALHPNSRIRVIEIESRMVEGARLFQDVNHQVHTRDNVEIRIEDGRTHLLRQRQRYDVIISIPSNPWLAGSADLFTSDFFARAAGALQEDGIFAQWVQLYGLDEESLRMVLRAFTSAFPETLLATTILRTDILLLGSQQPFNIDPDTIQRRMEYPAIQADLASLNLGIDSAYHLLTRIRLLTEGVNKLAGTGLTHTDDHPRLSYRAPLTLHQPTQHRNESLIAEHATGIAPLLRGSEHSLRHFHGLAYAHDSFLPTGKEAWMVQQLISGYYSPLPTP